MPTFRVEQYETWTQAYEIEAETKEEAIAKRLNGEGLALDNSLELIDICEERGASLKELRISQERFTEALERHNLSFHSVVNDYGLVESIRDVEET